MSEIMGTSATGIVGMVLINTLSEKDEGLVLPLIAGCFGGTKGLTSMNSVRCFSWLRQRRRTQKKAPAEHRAIRVITMAMPAIAPVLIPWDPVLEILTTESLGVEAGVRKADVD